eukprot:1531266-Pyramimonas_sp.AAC.1
MARVHGQWKAIKPKPFSVKVVFAAFSEIEERLAATGRAMEGQPPPAQPAVPPGDAAPEAEA